MMKSNVRKVALIYTLYDKPNYGCFLQAFAMSHILNNLGYETFFVKLSKKNKFSVYEEFCSSPLNFLISLRSKLRKLFKSLSKNRRNANSGNFLILRKSFFVDALEHLNQLQDPIKADVSIFGSDEIWNLRNAGAIPYPEYFGINVPSKLKIAYAPSIAGLNPSYIMRDKKRSHAIKTLDFIFPRDTPTLKLVDSLRTDHSTIVVDPTILIDDWSAFESGRDLGFDYILYYGYYPSNALIKWMKYLSSCTSLRLICLNFQYQWCDQSIACGPFDFLAILKRARYAITDTFHGCIFSSLLRKNFIAVDPSKKALDFMKRYDQDDIVYLSSELDLAVNPLDLFNTSIVVGMSSSFLLGSKSI